MRCSIIRFLNGMNFKEKLSKIVSKNNSLLCVGLDIDKDKIPKHFFKKSKDPYFEFNKSIIDSTKDLVCGYKLNMAFYEVLGRAGLDVLAKTIDYIPKDITVVLDGKRNDIGNTAKKYAQSLFETFNADAATVNPFLGIDGVKPFLEYKDKCSFILCRTSNPSAVDFQDLKISDKPLYEHVANKIKQWNTNSNCGAVVGATYPGELKQIRKILGEDIPILIPGIGAQGGNVEKTVKNAGELAIIVSCRGIIYSENPRESAIKLRDEINKYR